MVIHNIRIAGISATVPNFRIDNLKSTIFESEEEAQNFINTTGIYSRYAVKNPNTCTSDLCENSAKKLIRDLNWNISDIGLIIFVSQTPDYSLPATSCILQHKLGLNTNCMALDINLGCSGWVYGLSVAASLMQSGFIKKALLLAGDTPTKTKSPYDKSSMPLFGDAGTCTALEFNTIENESIQFNFGTDGNGFENIIIPGGGSRLPINEKSLIYKIDADGIKRNQIQSRLKGANIFTFGISKAPKSILQLMDQAQLINTDIDYIFLHQANLLMIKQIAKKIKFSIDKIPLSLREFGNTSSASIPLSICYQNNFRKIHNNNIIVSGFGVGLSWGTAYFKLKNPIITEIFKYNE